MMMTHDSVSRIAFRCDTPRCGATVETGHRFYNGAVKMARRQGWAIGTTQDACPAHHV